MDKISLQIGALGFLLAGAGIATADQIDKKVDRAADKTAAATKTAAHGASDSWLTAKTKIALFADSRVSGSQITVATKDGTIRLQGKVDTDAAKSAAEEIAQSIDGKKDVKDDLQVVAAAKRKMVDAKDDYLVSTVNKKLSKEALLQGSKIDVRSDAGVVTLSGAVPDLLASACASEAAYRVPGVRAVKNSLTLKSE